MISFRRRPLGLSALALLIAAAGCSRSDDHDPVAVPRPDTTVTRLCRNLDAALPETVDGRGREDPEPRSALTAGWGGSAIILRCGVERPPKMADPDVAGGRDRDAVAGGVEGVDWLMEKGDGGSFRFTTANRRAYVEVVVRDQEYGPGALVDLAPAIRRAIPEGIAG